MTEQLAGAKPPNGVQLGQLHIEDDTEVQFNFRVSRKLKDAYLASCELRGCTGTESLTRFMIACVTDAMGQEVLHLDGTVCPVSKLVASLTEAVLQKVDRDGTLKAQAAHAVAQALYVDRTGARQ